MNTIKSRWAQAQRRRDRLHLTVATALAILLLLLWLMGRGPNTAGCCVAPAVAPAATPAPAPVAAPVPAALPFAKIYFELDKFHLPADSEASLAPIVAYLQANAGAKAVISGFHDPTGNRDANHELAKNRAKAVRDQLKAAGIAEDRIVLQKPQETTGTGTDPEARRVEVSVQP
ncbi:MAG: OmpA family protein [Betaproteobacteria bacterium]